MNEVYVKGWMRKIDTNTYQALTENEQNALTQKLKDTFPEPKWVIRPLGSDTDELISGLESTKDKP